MNIQLISDEDYHGSRMVIKAFESMKSEVLGQLRQQKLNIAKEEYDARTLEMMIEMLDERINLINEYLKKYG